jgi:hypothetical protein
MRKNEKPAIPEMILHFLELGFISYPFSSRFSKEATAISIAYYKLFVKYFTGRGS